MAVAALAAHRMIANRPGILAIRNQRGRASGPALPHPYQNIRPQVNRALNILTPGFRPVNSMTEIGVQPRHLKK
jgi:hypothetical protein